VNGYIAPNPTQDMQFGEDDSSCANSQDSLLDVSDRRRRDCLLSKGASLFDGQEDDEDDFIVKEPELEFILDDSISSASSALTSTSILTLASKRAVKHEHNRGKKSINASRKNEKNDRIRDSPLAQITESISKMALFLCPATFSNDGDKDTFVMHKQSANDQVQDSEIDHLQIMISASSYGSYSSYENKFSNSPEDETTNAREINVEEVNIQRALSEEVDMACLRTDIATDIMSFLGLPQNSCGGVQSWLGDKENQSRAGKTVNELQNRCIQYEARRKRIRKLWNKWHSQAGSNVTRIPSGVFVHTTSVHQSFGNEIEIGDSVHEGNIFYDSDPEYFTGDQQTNETKTNCPWTINTSISLESTGSDKGTVPDLNPKLSEVRGVNALSENGSCDFSDDEEVKEFLKEFILGKIRLVWHPRGSKINNEPGCLPPVSVIGSFENGVRLPATIVQPKFMWFETCRPVSRQHKWSTTCLVPNSLEILSMVRIIKPENINRFHYPFAKADLAFLIICHDGESHLFEARSNRERDLFVHGLKLMVARLASLILVGDEDVFIEFYNPFAA